ncbi:MAG: hypothetical protein R6W78_04920 [Bacteroidales bacterium]
MNFRYFTISAILILFTFHKFYAQKSWDGGALTNNWGDSANWNPDGVPLATDVVQIGSGFDIIADVDAVCASITFLSGTSSSSLSLNSAITLTVTGNISYSNPAANSVSQTLDIADGILTCSNILLANTTNNTRTNILNINSGTMQVANNLSRGGATDENYVSVTGSAAISIGGTFSSGFTFSEGAATVNFNGAGNQTIPAYNFYNLTVSTGGTKTLSASTVVNGDFNLGSGSSFNPNNLNFTVAGNSVIAGTFADGNAGGTTSLENVDLSGGTINGGATGIININGILSLPAADAVIGRAAVSVAGALNIPAGRSFVINNANGSKTFTGNVTVDGSWENSGNAAVFFGGDLIVNASGSYISGTGTHTFSGASAAIGGTNAGISLPAVAVTGNIANNIICSVTSLSGTGSWTQAVNSILNVSGALTISSLNAVANGNTVNYNGTGAQSVPANTFYNLVLSEGNTKTLTGNIIVNNDFTIQPLTACNPNTFNLSVLGNTAIQGTYADGNIIGTSTFTNVDISGGTINGGANGVVDITGNLSLPSADATIGRVQITVTGTLDIPAGNILTISNNNGTKTFNGKITIDGSWNNSGNSAITIGGGLIVNNTAVFTSGTSNYTFSGVADTIDGTITDLSFTGIIITGNITNNLSVITTNLSGTGAWTQASGSTLSVSGAMTIAALSATAAANTVYYNGAGAQNIFATDYYNLQLSGGNTKTQLNDLDILNDLTIAAGVTYNIGTVSSLLVIGGNSLIDGILFFNTTTTKDVSITGNLSGSGSINISGGNLPHVLNLNGELNSINTLINGAGANEIHYTRNGDQTVFASNVYRVLTVSGSGTKSLAGDIAVAGATSVNGGTLSLNGYTMTTIMDITINNGAELLVNSNAGLRVSNNRSIINNGTFSVIGAPGNIATVNINGTGSYYYTQSDPTSVLQAVHYLFSNLNNGLNITNGTVSSLYNMSNGTFENGTGNHYLNLTGISMPAFPDISNVVFNTGPTYNVSRTSGIGALNFTDATGTLAGENSDNDNGNPGSLINWNNPSSTYYSTGNVSAGSVTSWTRNPDGTGANPSSVTDGLATLMVQDGHTVVVDNNGDIDVLKLYVGGGTSGTLRIGADAAQRTVSVRELLEIRPNATLNAGSQGSPSHNLLIYGNINNDGNFNLKPSSSVVNTQIFGNTVIQGTVSPVFNDVTFISGSNTTPITQLDVNGNIFIANGAVFNDNGLSHTVAGNWSVTGNGLYNASGTIVFDGLVNSIIDNPTFASVTFNNLVFSGGAAGTIQENLIVNGSFTITNNTFVSVPVNSVTCNGDFTVDLNATFSQSANSMNFSGTGNQTIALSGNCTFYNLYFSNGGANPKTVNGNINTTNLLIIYNGATVDGTGNHILSNGLRIDGICNWSGSVTMRGGYLYTANASNTLSLGTAVLNIDGYVQLTYAAPAISLQALINNNVNILSGYLLLNNNTEMAGQPAATFTLSAATLLYVRGADNFPAGFGTYTISPSSWVIYDGVTDQNITGGLSYGNLRMGGAGTNKTVDGNLDINGTLDLNNGITLFLLNYSHTIAGNIENGTNSTIDGQNATVTFDASDANQTIQASGTGYYSFRNLYVTLSGATATRTKTFDAGSTILISGGNMVLSNIGGSEAIKLIFDLNNNNIGGTPANLVLNEHCQINTDLADFGAGVTDNFTGTKSLHENSTVYFSLNGAQLIPDGFSYGCISFYGGNKTARGPLDINGDILPAGGTPVFYDNGFTHAIAGDWLLNNGAYYTQTSATGTIVFDGADQNIYGANFNNIIIANTGIATVTNNLTIYGNLTANAGSTIDFSTRNMTLHRNFLLIGNGLYTQTTGTSYFTGSSNQTITSNAGSYLGVVVINKPNAAGNQTVSVLSELHIAGNFTLTQNAGVFDISNQDVYFGGRLYVEANTVEPGAAFTAAGSNVFFDGTDAQLIRNSNANPLTFNNITFTAAGSKSFDIAGTGSRNMLVDGFFNIAGSTVIAGGWGNGGMDIYVRGDWNNTGTFSHNNARTVYFDGSNQSISSSPFWNIDFGGTNQKTLLGNITVNANLTISSDTLNTNDNNITVDGNWTNNAASAFFMPGTGAVVFNGGNATIYTGTTSGPAPGKSFYRVEINKNAGTAVLGGDLDVNHSLVINTGNLQTNAYSVWLAGDFINNGGTYNQNNNASILTLDAPGGNYQFIPNSGTFRGIIVDAPGAVFQVGDDFTVTNVDFVLSNGEFRLNGNQMNIAGNNRAILINNGIFNVDSASVIEFTANGQAINLSNGVLMIVGSPSMASSLNRSTGTFTISQTGGTIHARYYSVRGGNFIISGGTIDATDNFSDGTFAGGGGNAYLTLTGLDFADFGIENIIFNSGPVYNVSRTSGSGTVTFEDASGSLAGENYDQDNADPGTLLNWTFPSGFFWDGGAGTENWHDADNWSGNTLPSDTNIVYLDHTYVPGIYTVRVQAQNVDIKRIIMDAQGGNAINLIQENGYDVALSEHLQIGVSCTYSLTDNTTVLNVGKNWTNLGTFNHGNSTVTFNGTPGNYIISSGGISAGKSFYNLVINSPGSTYNLGNATDIDNNLTVTNGTFNLASGNNDITVGGNWLIDALNGGIFNASLADVTFDGSDQGITNGSFYNFITAGSGIKTLNSNIDINADITISSGTTLDALENNLYIEDDWINNGAFTQSGLGAVIFDGTGNQDIGQGTTATSFNNLSFLNAGNKTFYNNATIDGTFTINTGSGTVNLDTYVIDGTGSANVFYNFGTLELRGADNFPRNFEDIQMLNTSNVIYRADIDQTVHPTIYGNLTLRRLSAGTALKTAGGDLDITGNLYMSNDNNTVFDVAANNAYIKLTGGIAFNAGCDIIWGTGSSTLEHVGGDWNIDADLDSFNILILGGTGDKYTQGDLQIGGDLTVKSNVDLFMYQNGNRALFRSITGNASNTFTLESGARLLCATPSASGPAIPSGFGAYNLHNNSTFYLYSPNGVDQTLFTGLSIQYGNLIFIGTKTVTLDGIADLDVNGDLNTQYSTLIDNGRNIKVGGANIYLNNYLPSSTAISFSLDGFRNQYLRGDLENTIDFGSIICAGSGVKTLGDGNDVINIAGNLTISPSVTLTSNRNITFSGTSWTNNGIFTHSANTLLINGVADQTINPGAVNPLNRFNNITFRNNSLKSFITNGADINGNFIVEEGTVDLGPLTHRIAGQVTNNTGGILISNLADITFDGGNQGINSPAFSINNVVISGTGTKRLFSDWSINGDLTINAGTALNTSDNIIPTHYNIQIGGNWTNHGAYVNNTSTVTFNGSTSPVNITSGGSNFVYVAFNPSAAVEYYLQSPSTRISRTMNIGANASLSLYSNTLILGSNIGAGKLFTVDGSLDINENSNLLFNNQGSQSVMNVSGVLKVVGSSSLNLATISREVAGVAGSETQINILPSGTFAANNYLIEYLQDAGLNMQSGSVLDATYNLSNGTWSNIRNVSNVRYINLEADYSGDTIKNVIFNFAGTPIQGTHFNVVRELAATPVVFDSCGGNIGSYKYEKDDEAVPSANSGLLRWPAVTETYWTGAVNNDWHLAANWDNGVPTALIDAIIPDRPNDPIISVSDATCKNLTISNGTLILDNNNNITVAGDITIGTGTNLAIFSVNTPLSSIYAGGLWTRGTNGLFLHGNSTVIFNSASGAATIVPRNSAFYNVVFDNSITTFYISGNPVNIAGKFEILNGTVVPVTNNYVYNVAGDVSLSGGTFVPVQGAVAAGTIVLNGDNQQITKGFFHHLQASGTGEKTFEDSTVINGTTIINSTMTAAAGCIVDFNGNVSITSTGTFNDGGEDHHFSGAVWTGTGNYAGSGSVTFDRTIGNQTINKALFHNLYINCTGRVLTIADSVNILNNMEIRSGINYVNLQSNIISNTSASGSFTMQNNTRLYVYGNDNFPKSFATYSLSPLSYVYYYGSGDQLIEGITYGYLYLNNSNIKTLKGDITINGNLLFNSSTLDVSPNSFSIALAGTWNNNSTGNFICRNGEVMFTGGSNQAITFGGANINRFYNVTVAKTDGYAYANNNTSNDFIIESNLIVTSGRFHANNRSVYIGGDMVASGSGGFYNNTGTYILNKTNGTAQIHTNNSSLFSLHVNSSGNATFTALGNITLTGDLRIISGIFNGNGNTLTCGNGIGDAVNISGTFITGAGGTIALGNGTTLNVDASGRIEVVGTASQIARITNNASGGRYNFLVNGTIAAQYYLFEYMSASGIYLSETSAIDPVNNFSNGTFTRGAGTGQLLRIENTQSFVAPDYIVNVSFPLNPGGSASNVSKITGSTGTLEFYNATGIFAGENYDNDPLNLINWTGPVVLTWNGSISSDWNDSLNWTASYGPPIVPAGNENVIIAAATNQPVLTVPGAITGNLTINSGASVTLNTPYDAGVADLDVNGDITINGSLRLMSSGDYIHVEGSWTKAAAGTVILNGNVTFDGSGGAKVINNRGIAFTNLTIGGTSQYLLGWNTIVNKNLTVLAGSTLDVTPANYSLTVKGNWSGYGTFMPNLGKVTFNATTGAPVVYSGQSSFNDLDINAAGIAYLLDTTMSVLRNLNIISGTLNLNGQNLFAGDGSGTDNLTITGALIVGANGTVTMGNNSRLNVNSGGTLDMVGSGISDRAVVTAQGSSRYSFDVNSGAVINARFYAVGNTDADGLYIHSGAATSQVYNLSDGVFENGYPSGGVYLKIEHEPAWGDDTVKNVTFNTGPVYNVSRTSGTAVFYFQDALGVIGTYEYEYDINAPDPGSGLLHWPLLNTYIWTGAIDTDWHKPGNWSGGAVPDNTKNAVIPSSVANFPEIIANTAQAKSLTVYPGASVTVARDTEIEEDMVNSGVITASGSPVIEVGQNWTDINGAFNPGNSSVILLSNTGTRDLQVTTGSFYNLEINGLSVIHRLIRNLIVQNDLTISSGNLNMNGYQVYIGGGLMNSGSLTTGSQSIIFNGSSGNHLVDAGTSTLYNVLINTTGAASYLLNNDLSIQNNLTIQNGNLDLSPDGGVTSHNLNIGNRLSISGGSLYGRNGLVQIGENLIISGLGTFNCGTGTVSLLSNSGIRTIASRNNAFYNISFDGNATFRLSGNLDVNHDLTISAGILDVGTSPSYNIYVAGNWTNSATFVPRAGTVTFDGTNQTINKTLDETFYNISINNSTLLLNTGVNITNFFTLTSGNVTTQANSIVLGTGVSNTGSLSYTSGSIIGYFERWVNTLETDYLFPVGVSGNTNAAYLRFITNLSPGSVLASFMASDPGTTGLPVTDNGMPVDEVFTDGFWRFSSKNSMSSADYNIHLNGNGFISHTIDTATRILKRNNGGNWVIDGSHLSATGSVCHRTGLNGISVVSTDFCFGIISCTGGLIGYSDSVCAGDDVVPFINVALPTGGSSYTYTWQYTTELTAVPGDANWTDIAGSNLLTYDHGNLYTPTLFIRRTNGTGCPATYSNIILIHTFRKPAPGPVHHIPND